MPRRWRTSKSFPPIRNSRTNPKFWKAIALAASYLGNHNEAQQAYEKILKNGFQPVMALNLAELYIVQNRFEDALKLLVNDGFKQSKDTFIRL